MEHIIEKIAKIVAKAESTTHEAEAEVFMARAHAMMLEYGIELADLGQLDAKDAVGETRDAWDIWQSESYGFNLSGAVARYYGCRIIGWKRGNKQACAVYGRESARATTILMVPYVMRQVRRLAREAHRNGDYTSASRAATAIGKALTTRIWQMLRQAEKRVQATGRGNELVPVNAIEAYMKDRHGELRSRKSRAYQYDATAAGLAATVSLNLQAGSAGATKRLGGS